VAHVNKQKSSGGLGISLEGKDEESKTHHYVHTVLPEGPVGITGLIRSGDELLEVSYSLYHDIHVTLVMVYGHELVVVSYFCIVTFILS